MRGRLVILTYHRVIRSPDPVCTGHVLATDFAMQMQTLSRLFRPLPLREAAARLLDGTLPARAVCVTFDDGYADNESVALPILEQYSVPATFFVASGYLDGGIMWNDVVIEAIRRSPHQRADLADLDLGIVELSTQADRRRAVADVLAAYKYLPFETRQERVERLARRLSDDPSPALMMTSDQVRALHRAGMEVGAHTVTHPILSKIGHDAAEREIRESRTCLEALIDAPVRTFAYPNGRPDQDYRREHVDAVRRCGYDVAVSTQWGAAARDDDPYQLPRVPAWDTMRLKFALRVASTYLQPATGFA